MYCIYVLIEVKQGWHIMPLIGLTKKGGGPAANAHNKKECSVEFHAPLFSCSTGSNSTFLFFNMQPGFFPVMSLYEQINILETELYKLGMRRMYSKTDKSKNIIALIPFTRRIY